MGNHFYAVYVNYFPNSAPTNRMMAYIEAWAKMNVEVTVVFMLPDRKYSKVVKEYSNIHFKYMWESIPCKWRITHYILYSFYVYLFVHNLKPDDNVYVYGKGNMLPSLLSYKKINIFHEMTEHPAVVPLGVKFNNISIERYLKSCRHVNGLFVISTALKSYFVEQGVDDSKIHIVNMIVDPSRFNNVKKQKQSKKYIAYCGKASNNKDGVDQLIEAFALVNKKYPDIYLYIIGQAPDRKDINNNIDLAEKLGVSNRVVFTGQVPFSDMPQMLTDATVLALDRPDNLQAKHGFPTKLGEYLLTGNPVVVTRVGDISLFIEDGVSGIISEPSNPQNFASKICWLIEHPHEAEFIGRNGRKVALDKFNNETEAAKIVNTIFNVSNSK